MNETIKNDLLLSMKEQDKFKTSVLRMLKSSIQEEKIKKNKDLTADEILNVIKKQVKIRESSFEEYKKYNRNDLADDLEKEITILKSYLPKELSNSELNAIIEEQFTIVNPLSIKDMGKVINAISVIVGTRADMSKVSKIVKDKIMKL